MPGRAPDLSFDRVKPQSLTIDSLALRFFHEYCRFGVLGCASQIVIICFSQTVSSMKQSFVICFAPIIRVPSRSSCSDCNGRKACEAPYSTATTAPVTTPDK